MQDLCCDFLYSDLLDPLPVLKCLKCIDRIRTNNLSVVSVIVGTVKHQLIAPVDKTKLHLMPIKMFF